MLLCACKAILSRLTFTLQSTFYFCRRSLLIHLEIGSFQFHSTSYPCQLFLISSRQTDARSFTYRTTSVAPPLRASSSPIFITASSWFYLATISFSSLLLRIDGSCRQHCPLHLERHRSVNTAAAFCLSSTDINKWANKHESNDVNSVGVGGMCRVFSQLNKSIRRTEQNPPTWCMMVLLCLKIPSLSSSIDGVKIYK